MTMSKQIGTGIAIAALLLGTLAARAADLPSPSYKAPVYVCGFSWSGFYVGINAGYGFATADWSGPPLVSIKPKGFLAGATLGYNMQTGNIVWGVEADLDLSTIKGSDSTICGTPGCETKLTWLGTGRGRIGYAFDRWLPYVTGGVAYGSLKNSGYDGSETKSKLGWTLGAGVEYALMSSWSVKAEYLYVDLGTVTCTTCFTGAPQDIKFKANIARLGVNYRF